MSGTNPVVVKAGQTVRFPVASSDPLAQFQQLKTADLVNLHDLAVIRNLIAVRPTVSTGDISNAVTSILSSTGTSQITTVNFQVDFQVEAGATVIFAGPITTISARSIYVDGTMIVYGSLNITCQSIGATPVPAPPLPPAPGSGPPPALHGPKPIMASHPIGVG